MTDIRGRVLIVAGSDSGGGAGIQADVKTVAACGAYGATAVTAVTVQNTRGVSSVHDIPTEIVADQMRVVLEDIGADVVKTGMLHTSAIIRRVLTILERYAPGIRIVVDPVMVAKGGARLLTEQAEDVVRRSLMPRAHLVTPNIPEAEVLIGQEITHADQMEDAAQELMQLGPKAVLLKGGHLPGEPGAPVVDVLATLRGVERFESLRIDSQDTHGTGCTLASAIAALLARGYRLESAVERARYFVQEAIRTAPGFGSGHGPLNHMHAAIPPEDWPDPAPAPAT